MSIELDHAIVPSHHAVASAERLAALLDVPWSATGVGPFTPVYVNDGLTLDFIQTDEPFEIYHFCFRVDEARFDAILERLRAAGIPWRGDVRGPTDGRINTDHGGRMLYWNEPDGHQWEMLTVSYARRPEAGRAAAASWPSDPPIASPSDSGAKASPAGPPGFTGVDHVHVYVADRVAAERWYARVLGLRRVERLTPWAGDGGPLTLADPADSVHLALFERPPQACRSTVALGVDADAFVAWRRHLGAVLDSAPILSDHAMSWSLYFTDPDSNPYEITCYDHAALAPRLAGETP